MTTTDPEPEPTGEPLDEQPAGSETYEIQKLTDAEPEPVELEDLSVYFDGNTA